MESGLCYLLKPSSKQCFFLGQGQWQNVFPDVGTNKWSKTFKYSDIFSDRKMKKSSYQQYVSDTVNRIPTHAAVSSYRDNDIGLVLEKVKHWAGNDDILFTYMFYAETDFVLTGSSNPYDRLGIVNHYLKKTLIRYANLARKFRVWRLTRKRRDLAFVIREAKQVFHSNTSNAITVIATAEEPE